MQWSKEEAERLCRKSPWARVVEVSIPSSSFSTPSLPLQEECAPCEQVDPGEGFSRADEMISRARNSPSALLDRASYLIWFAAATPIRLARARLGVLAGQLTEDQAWQHLEREPFGGAIVIAVTALSPGAEKVFNVSEQEMRRYARLELQPDGGSVPLLQYLSPEQLAGNTALLVFSRDPLGESDCPSPQSQFAFRVTFAAGVSVEAVFPLNLMEFRHRLSF